MQVDRGDQFLGRVDVGPFKHALQDLGLLVGGRKGAGGGADLAVFALDERGPGGEGRGDGGQVDTFARRAVHRFDGDGARVIHHDLAEGRQDDGAQALIEDHFARAVHQFAAQTHAQVAPAREGGRAAAVRLDVEPALVGDGDVQRFARLIHEPRQVRKARRFTADLEGAGFECALIL